MELFLFLIFLLAALALLYAFVIGVWKGLSRSHAMVMVAANCILLALGVFAYNATREEDNLQYQESLADLMRSVESAIRSDHAPAAAAILHKESGKIEDADTATWKWVTIYDKTMAEMDKLNTEKAATKEAEDRPQ
jgi:hypothetical protein